MGCRGDAAIKSFLVTVVVSLGDRLWEFVAGRLVGDSLGFAGRLVGESGVCC